jgi:O-antigen/teichoic acid export membrane protein
MDTESHDTIVKSFRKKSVRQYGFFLLIAPSWYIIKLLLTNALSVAEIWLLYWIINIISLLSIYNDLWLADCLQYFIPKYTVTKDTKSIFSLISFTFLMQFVTGIFIVAWLYFWAPFLAEHYFHTQQAVDIIRIFCRYFLFFNIIQVCANIFVAYQQPHYQNITELARMRTVIGMIMFFAWYGVVDIEASAYARLAWTGVSIIFALGFFLVKYAPLYKGIWISLQKDKIRTWMNYAIRAFIWWNISVLFMQIDQLIIISLWWTEVWWYYTTYQMMFSVYTLVLTPLAVLIYPLLTQFITEDATVKLKNFLIILYKIFFLSGLLFALICWLYGQQIATMLFSEKFVYSWKLVQWWWLLQILWWINWLTLIVYWAKWFVKQRVYLIGVWLLINIATLFMWYHFFWLYWCIASLWCSFLFITLYSQFTIKNVRWLSDLLDRVFIMKNMLIALSIFLLFYLLHLYMPLSEERIWWWVQAWIWSLLITWIFLVIHRWYIKTIYTILKK